jgi:hypothetical protein
MRRFRHFPKTRDILAILLAFALITGSFYFYLTHPEYKPATGFGPEWQCSDVARGGASFCVKKPLADPANKTTTPN